MSVVLMLDGSVVTSFASSNTDETEENVIEIEENEEDCLGISLDELKDKPKCPEEWAKYSLEKDNYNSELWFKSKLDKNGYSILELRTAEGTDPKNVKSGWNVEVYSEDNIKTPFLKGEKISSEAFKSSIIDVGTKEIYIRVINNENNKTFYTQGLPFEIKITKYESDMWETESNDEVTSAMEIKSGEKYFGSIHAIQDIDCFKYVTEGKGYFTFDFCMDPDLASVEGLKNGWDVSVLDEKGNEIVKYASKSGAIITELDSYTFPFEKGTPLYIKVECHEKETMKAPKFQPYNIKVNFKADDNWETEYNDSLETADEVSVNSVINGSTIKEGDEDFYKFNISKKGNYKIKLEANKRSEQKGKTGSYTIIIYDKTGEKINEITDVLANDVFEYESEKPLSLNAGNCYIDVKGYNARNNGATYKLSLISLSPNNDDSKPNNDNPTPQNGGYTISYNGIDGAVYNTSDFVFTFDPATMGKAIKLPTAKDMTKTGFKFLGWYDQSGKKVKKITKKMKQNVVLVAKWKENKYSIVYKVKKPAKGVRVTGKVPADKKGLYTATRTIKGSEISATGYELAGWTRAKNSTVVDFKVGDKVSGLEPKNNKKVKLYAIWKAVESKPAPTNN